MSKCLLIFSMIMVLFAGSAQASGDPSRVGSAQASGDTTQVGSNQASDCSEQGSDPSEKVLAGSAQPASSAKSASSAQPAGSKPGKKASVNYHSGHLGLSIVKVYNTPSGYDNSWDYGAYNIGLAQGYDFWEKVKIPIRVEAEFIYRGRESESVSPNNDYELRARLCTLMAQGWLDIPLSKNFKPYIGAGAGLAFVDMKTRFDDRTVKHISTKPGWMVGGGFAGRVGGETFIDLGYRYIKSEGFNARMGSRLPSYKFDCSTQEVRLGLRSYF